MTGPLEIVNMADDINKPVTDRVMDCSQISDRQLRAKQIDVLYDQLHVAIRATIATALILVAVLWTVTPLPLLLAWFALFLLQTSIRLALQHGYRNRAVSPARTDYWLRWFIFGVGISGVTWGSTILLVVPEGSLFYLGFVSLWLCGLSAGSIASLSVIKAAFFVFILPALLPPALALLSIGGKEEITVALGLFLFMGFISLNAHRMHKTLLQSLRLQFRNEQLVHRLDAQRVRVERLNDRLERRVAKRTLALSLANDRLRMSQKRLEHLAHHDPLTDLPNRLLFSIRLDHALERCRREGGRVAVLFFDLDRFKYVNDSMGHAAGDRLLQQLSARLLGSVREEDTVARQSGDEFMILLEGLTGGRDAVTVAEKALSALGAPFDLEGHLAYITGSVGISLFPDDASTAEMLLKNADTALYRAKHKGRNNFQFFNKQPSAALAHRQIQETSLRRAIHNEELELYYQPQMDLSTGRVVGAEALVRWRHEHLGLIMPDRFLPVAEGSGLVLELDRWVLRKACAQAQVWQDAGWVPLRIAVNISQCQLLQGDLPKILEQVFGETELNPSILELEFAEGVLLGLTEQALDTLNKVNALGVSLAMDNVGKKGYSSLTHLRRVNFHTVKIDRRYIRSVSRRPDDTATVAKIIDAANRLHLNVVAQGVERSGQREVLQEQGCKQAQGYLYAPPLTAREFTKYLKM